MRTQLAEACRIASNWITDHPGTAHRGTHRGENSVFLADTVKVTRSEFMYVPAVYPDNSCLCVELHLMLDSNLVNLVCALPSSHDA